MDTVRAVPGVAQAVPELTFRAAALVKGADTKPSYGHAWTSAALTPFTLAQGRAPRAAPRWSSIANSPPARP